LSAAVHWTITPVTEILLLSCGIAALCFTSEIGRVAQACGLGVRLYAWDLL